MATLDYTDNRSTDAYKFTITDKSDPQLAKLKRMIAKRNKEIRITCRKYSNKVNDAYPLQRVTIMARGKRIDKGEPLHENARTNLQHRFAERYDVYVHSDRHNCDILNEEIMTGLTGHQQRLVSIYERDIRDYKRINQAMLKDSGIYTYYLDDVECQGTYENMEKELYNCYVTHGNTSPNHFYSMFSIGCWQHAR